jgi:hypothetical protein
LILELPSFSLTVAGRSVRLSKTYVGISIFFAALAIFLTNIQVPSGTSSARPSPPVDPQLFFRFLGLPFLTLPALTMATPVMLVFVYDKNNGVLEYLLSLGRDQSQIFRAYLKAALFLASIVYAGEITLYIATGLLAGVSFESLILISGLVLGLSLSAVCLVVVVMMAVSALQKQRVGANQPLGTGIGVFLVMPSVFLSFLSVFAEVLYSIVVIGAGLVVLVLAGRLINREKLLP